jgi:CO/xanthine dehydrogenase FAD-binding subunit
MDIISIRHIRHPRASAEITSWRAGNAWLAGGTWLFSEPQPQVDTLIDLASMQWPALSVTEHGLEIAATCPIGVLAGFVAPDAWIAAPLLKLCAESLLASFKVTNMATVGGNICMSLPAGAMSSLATALEATYTLWPRDAPERIVPAIDFITGNHANILQPGELLRGIHIPAATLCRRFAFRRASLTNLGRSAALIVGTRGVADESFVLTITAATPQPVQLRFAAWPDAEALRHAIAEAIPEDGYFHDPHGAADYKRHLTLHFAEQIRCELATGAGA